MYTNTIKIEYILYILCTTALRPGIGPILFFCPWWHSEGPMVEPGGRGGIEKGNQNIGVNGEKTNYILNSL